MLRDFVMEYLPPTGIAGAVSASVVFVYKLLDKRITQLEDGKADIEDVEVVRDYLKQLLEAQDKRAENVETLLRQLVQNCVSIHGCVNKSAIGRDDIQHIVEELKKHIVMNP